MKVVEMYEVVEKTSDSLEWQSVGLCLTLEEADGIIEQAQEDSDIVATMDDYEFDMDYQIRLRDVGFYDNGYQVIKSVSKRAMIKETI